MNSPILLCSLVGVLWAASPLLGRLSGVSAPMMTVMVVCGSIIAALPAAFSQNYAAAGSRALLLGLAAGITNGLGLFAFYRLVAGSNEGLWEISRVIPIALVLVPIGIAIGARILFGEALTNEKFVGLALACGAIWFLK